MNRNGRQAPSPVQAGPEQAKVPVLYLAALVVLIAIVFGGAATHDFIGYDDPEYVTNNAVVQHGLTFDGIRYAFTSLTPYYWQPLTWLSLMIDTSIWGIHAGPPLVENVLLHAIAALLLFFTFAKATGDEWRSLALAALWAIHPLRVESVAWVAERKDVLATLFFIAAMLAYVNGRKALIIAAFILAVMAKPMAITFPFALLLLDYWPLNRRPSFIDKIPLFMISIIVVALTFMGQSHAIGGVPIPMRLANAVTSAVAYLGNMLLPVKLAVVYPYPLDIDGRTVAACVFVLIALTVAAFLRKRYALMGWLWYLITLVPVIGLVQAGPQSMADRFTYIPSIGIIAAVVWLIADSTPQRAAAAIGAVAIVVFAILSFRQVTFWRDSETLFTHAIAVTKNNVVAELSLGDAMQAKGDLHTATDHYLEAARLSHGAPLPLAAAGAALIREQQYERAVPFLQHALAANPNEPGARDNLALALTHTKPDEAIRAFANSAPTAAIWNGRGSAYATKGDTANAEQAYRESLRLDPKFYDAHMNYAALLSRVDRNNEALEHLGIAAKLQPSSVEPRIYRALVLANLGRRAEAAAIADEAQRVNPTASNDFFTNALHLPPADNNLSQFIVTMRAQQ
jgi:tetratricopeptide (TPR) repeat protein